MAGGRDSGHEERGSGFVEALTCVCYIKSKRKTVILWWVEKDLVPPDWLSW
jgi:hypothetical protein